MTSPYFGFSPDDLRRIESTAYIARFDFYETLDSTNDLALALVRDAATELPALVLAANQTAGRGRGANTWLASSGALTFSLAIEPPEALPADRLPLVSLAAGLAVCKTLAKLLPTGSAIGLKWPNDVLLDLHKVCGILVEAIPTPSRRLVIGIGLNVNNELPEVDGSWLPTSMASVADTRFPLSNVLNELVSQLDDQFLILHNRSEAWIADYQRYCTLTGHTVRIDTGTEQLTGVCLGVAASGALRIRTPGGIQNVYTGTIVAME